MAQIDKQLFLSEPAVREDGNSRYLRDQLCRIDCFIQRELARMRSIDNDGQTVNGVVLNDVDADALADRTLQRARPSAVSDEKLARIESRMTAGLAPLHQTGALPPLELLVLEFGLSLFERDVLMVLLAPEIEGKYRRLFAYLQDDLTRTTVSFDLIFRLLCRDFEETLTARHSFGQRSPLVRYGLVQLERFGDEAYLPFLERSVGLDDAVVDLVLNQYELDNRLRPVADWVNIDKIDVPLTLFSVNTAKNLENVGHAYESHIKGAENGEQRRAFTCCLIGQSPSVTEAAAAVCRIISVPLLTIDMAVTSGLKQRIDDTLMRAVRDARIFGAALLLRNFDVLFEERPTWEASYYLSLVNRRLSDFEGMNFWGVNEPLPALQDVPDSLLEVRITAPGFETLKAMWKRELDGASIVSDTISVDEFAGRYRFIPSQIATVVRQAKSICIVENGKDGHVDRWMIIESANRLGRRKMGDLACQVNPVFEWSDIILPDDRFAQLLELVDQVHFRQKIVGEWGFHKIFSRGEGLSALFSGPSGTGKTMAAEIVANRLEMDLYKVNLPGIVSKYIGETEKNLERLFQEADQSHGILFFDEADALFGKRTEIKDSHDRYANIEIDYLLQRIEAFDGLVILSTNVRGHLDEAFTRRLRFCIEFPLPGEAQRKRIWEKVFPAQTPVAEDVDFDFLAKQFKFSGGNIKNVALASAFLAARNEGQVTMTHIILAIRREYQKMGKLCTKSDFGRYFSFLPQEGVS